MIQKNNARIHFLILYVCLSVLGLTHINTDVSLSHMFSMSLKLLFVLLFAYGFTKFLTPSQLLDFQFRWAVVKQAQNLNYLLIGFVLGSVLIPFYLWHSQAYLNWFVDFKIAEILKLFIGTNALGIWDELFFINIVFVLLRFHLNFWKANLAQAVLFTTFLFELGFTGWGPLIIYPFALTQGYVYEKTKSLGLVLILHLTLDFILFCSLLYWHWSF